MADTYELDEQSKKVLAMLDGPGIPQCSDMTPEESREWMGQFMDKMALDPLPEIAAIEDIRTGGNIPVRLYRPLSKTEGKLPAMIFFHAGGYVFGEPRSMNSFCRLIAREAPVSSLRSITAARRKPNSPPPMTIHTPRPAGSPIKRTTSASTRGVSRLAAIPPAARLPSRSPPWRSTGTGRRFAR